MCALLRTRSSIFREQDAREGGQGWGGALRCSRRAQEGALFSAHLLLPLGWGSPSPFGATEAALRRAAHGHRPGRRPPPRRARFRGLRPGHCDPDAPGRTAQRTQTAASPGRSARRDTSPKAARPGARCGFPLWFPPPRPGPPRRDAGSLLRAALSHWARARPGDPRPLLCRPRARVPLRPAACAQVLLGRREPLHPDNCAVRRVWGGPALAGLRGLPPWHCGAAFAW